jgi:hypothetical protein
VKQAFLSLTIAAHLGVVGCNTVIDAETGSTVRQIECSRSLALPDIGFVDGPERFSSTSIFISGLSQSGRFLVTRVSSDCIFALNGPVSTSSVETSPYSAISYIDEFSVWSNEFNQMAVELYESELAICESGPTEYFGQIERNMREVGFNEDIREIAREMNLCYLLIAYNSEYFGYEAATGPVAVVIFGNRAVVEQR